MLPSNQPRLAAALSADYLQALTQLERVIKTDIEMMVDQNYHFKDDMLKSFQNEVTIIVNEVKNVLDCSDQHLHDKEEEEFVQYHQLALIRLAGSLANYVMSPSQQDTSVREVVKYLYLEVQDLLIFIRKRFPDRIAQNAWIPDNSRWIIAINIKPTVDELRAKLNALGVDERLATIVLAKLDELVDGSIDDFYYYEITYLLEFAYELTRFRAEQGDATMALLRLVYYLNYNTHECYEYIIKTLEQAASEADNNVDRMAILRLAQKELNQIVTKPGFARKRDRASLKTEIGRWLEEEIRFCDVATPQVAPELNGMRTDEPFQTDLTVAEIAYFLKLLIELGIIKARRRIAKILRFITKYISTDNTDSISLQSLSNKYNKPDGKTMESVKVILLRMVGRIDADVDRIYGIKK
ncbi:hypothetical protein [Dawidia soli]|uniref:Uncharacterized protein n=1 Tax=Dawidia soli TaxID=2782352 RepID=A0AAP2GJ08_9BACT|nr:hypothetical protein [Dawidia soli]MBT1688896.1 hypothetical protein [Dawidia soli]